MNSAAADDRLAWPYGAQSEQSISLCFRHRNSSLRPALCRKDSFGAVGFCKVLAHSAAPPHMQACDPASAAEPALTP